MYNTIIFEYSDYNKELDIIDELKEEGSLFIVAENNLDEKGVIRNNFFEIIEKYNSIGFHYINTIICIKEKEYSEDNNKIINSKVFYLIWFVKNYKKMVFDKDKIREKHIWKNVEWGRRKKNYNPKGKDPGNVWIPTKDNGKGKITDHIIMKYEEVLSRCIKSTSKENDSIYISTLRNIDKEKIPSKRIYKIHNKKQTEIKRIIPKYKLSDENSNLSKNLEYNVNFKTSELMEEINDNSIDLMVTSPPYWDLKNYQKDGQIGQESYEEYLNRLDKVWKETYRVLKDNGSMWINVNTRTRNKKPILIPADIIKHCEKIGFYLRDIVIWHKSSAIPTHKKNIVDRHEYLLWFSKSIELKFHRKKLSIINEYKNDLINGGDIWNINRKAGTVGKNYIHPAIYPKKLISRIIDLLTNEGDTVLDPFLGSGTSMICAINKKRSFIGYEFNEDFVHLIQHRMEKENIDNEKINYNFFKNVINEEKNLIKENIFR